MHCEYVVFLFYRSKRFRCNTYRINNMEVIFMFNYDIIYVAILIFGFYDKDGGGFINKDELHVMIQDIYGKHFEGNKQAKL